MNFQLLDSCVRLDSPVRRWRADLKLLVAVAGVVATVLVPIRHWPIPAAWSLFLAFIAWFSRIPKTFLLKRLLVLEPLVVGVALLAWFQPQGGWVFGTLIVKSTLSLFTMLLLSNTTPFSELLRVLRRCRVPALLLTTLALMYRYLFVLVNETERMLQARASRTFTRRRMHLWKTLGLLVGQLFVRSTERAERIYAAMCARGWK